MGLVVTRPYATLDQHLCIFCDNFLPPFDLVVLLIKPCFAFPFVILPTHKQASKVFLEIVWEALQVLKQTKDDGSRSEGPSSAIHRR